MASQIPKILPTLLIIAAAFLLNFGCCQQNESQTPGTLRARNASSSTEILPLNTTITFSNETTGATPSPTEAGTNSTTVAAATTTAENCTWLWLLIGGIVSVVLLCGLVVCIMCYMRRGSQQIARETVIGESGTVTTFKDSTMSNTMNVVDKNEHEHSKAKVLRVPSDNCCSQSVGSSVWQQPVANLQLVSLRGENEVPLEDDMSTTGSIAMSTTALGGSSMAVPTDYMSKLSGESRSGSSATFKDSAMNGNNAATNSSIASQTTTSKQGGGGVNVPNKLPTDPMADLAKVNARLAQRKKQKKEETADSETSS
ncbi:hypothetical protein niasHT_023367 [Heterodera trifolii]|uniref:Uncharacterized protein n=1 Tax=Heterodera trifolii TaxID=157864 RepID=A0ABD2K3V5_9BILA